MNIRQAKYTDIVAMAEVHVHACKQAYQGIQSQQHLDSLCIDTRIKEIQMGWGQKSRTTLVLEHNNTLLGFSRLGPSKDEGSAEHIGELYSIYLHPKYWGQGLGHFILSETIEVFQNRGFLEIRIYVLKQNERAIQFYQNAFFSVDEDVQKQCVLLDGSCITSIRMSRIL